MNTDQKTPELYHVRITSGQYAGQYVGQIMNWMTPQPPDIRSLLVAVKRLMHEDAKDAMRFERATAERVQAELRGVGVESELVPWS